MGDRDVMQPRRLLDRAAVVIFTPLERHPVRLACQAVSFAVFAANAAAADSRVWVVLSAAGCGAAAALAAVDALASRLARTAGSDAVPEPAPEPAPDDPWRWVPYGAAGNEVHHCCAADRPTACSHCAGVMGEVSAP